MPTRSHSQEPQPGTFGAVVRRLRIERGLSQEELADRMEVGQQNISRIELSNVKRPGDELIKRLAIALEVPPSRLWELSTWPDISFQIDELRDAVKPLDVHHQRVMAHLARWLGEQQPNLSQVDAARVVAAFEVALRQQRLINGMLAV